MLYEYLQQTSLKPGIMYLVLGLDQTFRCIFISLTQYLHSDIFNTFLLYHITDTFICFILCIFLTALSICTETVLRHLLRLCSQKHMLQWAGLHDFQSPLDTPISRIVYKPTLSTS